MDDNRSQERTDLSPWRRQAKASLWFALAILSFYLIGFVWKDARDQQQHWPMVEARIDSVNIEVHREAEGVDNQGTARLMLSYESTPGTWQTAQLQVPGRLKELRQRQQDQWQPNTFIQIRIDPAKPQVAVETHGNSWMLWVLAVVSALFFGLNGMTVLLRRPV